MSISETYIHHKFEAEQQSLSFEDFVRGFEASSDLSELFTFLTKDSKTNRLALLNKLYEVGSWAELGDERAKPYITTGAVKVGQSPDEIDFDLNKFMDMFTMPSAVN
jgi:hypothetical protein